MSDIKERRRRGIIQLRQWEKEHSTAGRVQRVATEKAPRAVKRKIVVVATEVKEKQACCEVNAVSGGSHCGWSHLATGNRRVFCHERLKSVNATEFQTGG